MIQKFVDRFQSRKSELEARFKESPPTNYYEIVQAVVHLLGDSEDYRAPDAQRIHELNDGDYQGTLVYVIAAQGYQPSDYWFVKVSYGSCSGCDTLQAIRDDDPEQATKDYVNLALHIVEGLKSMDD